LRACIGLNRTLIQAFFLCDEPDRQFTRQLLHIRIGDCGN
jgi:hypothetical protein